AHCRLSSTPSPPGPTLVPYTTLFRSADPAPTYVLAASVPAPAAAVGDPAQLFDIDVQQIPRSGAFVADPGVPAPDRFTGDRINRDRKSTRLNSSHVKISYAVFCLKKK